MIYLGADHRGYPLKEKIKAWLSSRGIQFEDFGAHAVVSTDDYTDYAAAVAMAVSKDPTNHRGMVLCGSGAGICVAANKVKGIRAALAMSPEMSRAMRNDDDVNVLCLASDFVKESEALEIVEVFLETPFGAEERYKRRIRKIQALEK